MLIETTNFLKTIAPMSDPLVKAIHDLLRFHEFRKKERFLEPGDVSNHVFIIHKGLVRGYYIQQKKNAKDRERTSWIMKELDVVTEPRSFFSRTPTIQYIEALERTSAVSITYEEMEWLYNEFPEFNQHGRILNQQYNVRALTRAEELMSNDASTRYQIFQDNYPELIKRVPTKHIASYIGVTEECLYRIKNGNYNMGKKT